MKVHMKIKCFGFGVLLLLLMFNNKIGFSLNDLKKTKPCAAQSKNACIIICQNWDLNLKNDAETLKKILKTEEKKFKACTLILKNCTHRSSNNTEWEVENTDGHPKVENLKIFNSSIDLNRLHLKIFKNLRKLKIKNTTTVSLQSDTFRQLPKLQKLQIKRNNSLKWVEKGFLQNLSLKFLQIQGLNLNQEKTAQFFKNLTGERKITSIRRLDWSHNNIGNFSKDFLTQFSNLESLTLTNCSISKFDEDIFLNKRIMRVRINENKIQKIPEKTFRPLFENASFVFLKGNNFTCDCDLKWLQDLVKRNKFFKKFKLDCTYPEGIDFLEAELCPNTYREVIQCTPKGNSEMIDDYKLRPLPTLNNTSKKFLIINDEPEFIELIISGTVDKESVFLWYGNYANPTSPQFNCLEIKQQKFIIHVSPDSNYLICLATVYKIVQIDVFDCIPFKTKPFYEDQPWLTKKSIPLSLTIISVAFILALGMGALIMYLSVRKNPSLIRSSKRVIEVKRHDKAQLLIMPRGYENTNRTEASTAPLYSRALLEPSRSSLSCDTISTASYVSAHQPTPLEIFTYRLSRLRELFQRNNTIPSSVSRISNSFVPDLSNRRLPPDVDLLFEYEWYTITTTTTTITQL